MIVWRGGEELLKLMQPDKVSMKNRPAINTRIA
jgi:hypothetical protein